MEPSAAAVKSFSALCGLKLWYSLPVTLANFAAVESENAITLTFTTTSELNADLFVIQRSAAQMPRPGLPLERKKRKDLKPAEMITSSGTLLRHQE